MAAAGKMAPMFVLLLVSVLFSSGLYSQLAVAATAMVPAIYVFGDSTVDVGNNNYLPGEIAKANFPHNGIDFPHGKPTGRFSNGYNGADFLAKMIGMKRSPPPYLSLTSDAQIFRGVNFASGGSGILDATTNVQGPNSSIPMNMQIKYFEVIKRRLEARMAKASSDIFISKSLFVFSTGNNDMFGFFARASSSGSALNSTQINQFIDLLASQFRGQLQMLYGLGARKFAVIGAAHLGCVPLLRRTTPSGDCVVPLNEVAQVFNRAMQVFLRDLASIYTGMKYSFANAYEVVSTVEANPLKFGYKEFKSACCGGGRFNAEALCTVNATYCPNRREYFYWDWVHPTQATYKLMARKLFHGGLNFATPINIKQLAWS